MMRGLKMMLLGLLGTPPVSISRLEALDDLRSRNSQMTNRIVEASAKTNVSQQLVIDAAKSARSKGLETHDLVASTVRRLRAAR